ncbi:MAG TPA: 2Fe-2S iron-sulfur cluster-binding protein [Beijerinckiaceae bacterium]|jgi:3-phenylpropionate/trans-cinnamate dioxygenase ferredoxin reductase subunit
MSSRCELQVNGRVVQARVGDTLVDAGLAGRVLIPHDCCSGQCGSCRVEVLSGAVDDEGTREGATVLGCRARLNGDAAIAFEEVPVPVKRSGQVAAVRPLSRDILEVVVRLPEAFTYRPGQYVGLRFAGFPSRDYSPAARLDGTADPRELVFHIKRLRRGRVSTALGERIRVGHKVQVRGPYGQAFLRPGSGPLVLVAGGTGFAPIWAIAREARLTQPERELIVVAGARDGANLYMGEALQWLADTGPVQIIAACERDAPAGAVPGRPSHYLPLLGPEDTVYVAGSPRLVAAVKTKAQQAGAACHADPFTPSTTAPSLWERLSALLPRWPAAVQASSNSAA